MSERCGDRYHCFTCDRYAGHVGRHQAGYGLNAVAWPREPGIPAEAVEMYEHARKKASDLQQGGDHYKKYPIQPAEFLQRNRVGWCEANAIKYAVRHREKNGAADVKKAIHYLELLLQWEYGE